jgi:nucleotide-binding universal stress UspA family protein
MLSINKIICPTDFSEPSFEALKVADELAGHFGADLFLIHVVGLITATTPHALSGFDLAKYNVELKLSAIKGLDELVKEKVSDKTKVHPTVLEGNAADEIVQFAATNGADMIVIATHGRTGWRRFLFGSVAEKVVRTAECPVLTIQEPREESTPEAG